MGGGFEVPTGLSTGFLSNIHAGEHRVTLTLNLELDPTQFTQHKTLGQLYVSWSARCFKYRADLIELYISFVSSIHILPFFAGVSFP